MIAVLFLLWTLFISGGTFQAEMVATNVALGKIVRYCGNSTGFDYLVDGVTNERPPDSPIFDCKVPAYIEVDMRQIYYVNYVVIYGDKDNKTTNQLDYFSVGLSVGSEQFMCSSHPKPATLGLKEDRKLMVNCRSKLAQNIRLTAYSSGTLSINEIEAYSYAVGGGESMMVYRGCFRSFHYTMRDKNPLSCYSICTSRFPYMALSKKHGCYCGLEMGTGEVPRVRCYEICGSKNYECGGNGVYSVFIVLLQLPYYVGCFDLTPTNKLVTMETNMTIARCLKHCGKDYFALLFGGKKCSCEGEALTVDRHRQQTSNSCSVLCSDDDANFCGGVSHAAVYKTCLPTCDSLLSCKDWDEYGACRVCTDNHEGLHCLQKSDRMITSAAATATLINATTSHRDEPEREVSTSLISCGGNLTCPDARMICGWNKEGIMACLCVLGYKREEDKCADMDECLKNPCDNSSKCVNTEGSYECKCPLRTALVGGKCVYSEHCQRLSLCDLSTTTCMNVGTSFKCICKEGFKPETPFRCREMDDCQRDASLCGEQAKCLNVSGKFKCQCDEGLEVVKTHFKIFCEDINECTASSPCNGTMEVCINNFASYACECSAGFLRVKGECKALNVTSSEEEHDALSDNVADMKVDSFQSNSLSLITSLVAFVLAFVVCLVFKIVRGRESPLPEFDENDADLIRYHLPELMQVYEKERSHARRVDPNSNT